MSVERISFLETLKSSYSAYYNINPNDNMTELPLAFRADFFSRGENYFLVKSAVIWVNETNEYVYLFSAPSFDVETVEKCMDYAIEDGLPRVKPHKDHNYTNFIAIFVADSFDEETVKAIKKRKFNKSYNHSLWGFSLLKSAAVELSTQRITTNRAGHDLSKFYRKLFAAEDKKAKAASGK